MKEDPPLTTANFAMAEESPSSTADSTMAEAAVPDPPASPFLALPAELRNRIYRYCLNTSTPPAVTHTGITEPSLLHTNKQIRHEAITIFYLENSFAVHMHDFNSSILLAWRDKCAALKKAHKIRKVKICGSFSRTPNWKNLKVWLKRYHARELNVGCGELWKGDAFPVGDPFRLETHVMATTFGLVGSLKRSHRWDEVEVQVERLHLILVGLNVLWK